MKNVSAKAVAITVAVVLFLANFLACKPLEKVKTESVPITAKLLVNNMGRGINLGNTFERSLNPRSYSDVKTAIDSFIAEGFTTIRIPFNWGGRDTFTIGRVDANGNLITTHDDVKTLKDIVDYVTLTVNSQRARQGLKPIILVVNIHHEDWAMKADIVTNKSTYDANMAKVRNIWTGICELFKDTPYTLTFEVFNEPHFAFESGANAEASVVDLTNQIYNIIRSYTYNGRKPHQYRNIIFGGVSYNGPNSLVSTFSTQAKLPGGANDGYMLGTFHSYPTIDKITTELGKYNNIGTNFSNKYDIPVYMGEFGYKHQGNITDQVKNLYMTIGNEAVKRNFSFTVWDDNGWFKIYDRSTGTFNELKDQFMVH